MDTNYWTKLSPKIQYEVTAKQYYGRYLCKMVLEVYGGRLIDTNINESIGVALLERLDTQRSYNYGGSWLQRRINELKSANVDQLQLLRKLKQQYRGVLKFRVEEPWLQVYAKDENALKDIASDFDDFTRKSIVSISTPQPGTESNLEKGKIYLKSTRIPHKYKIHLRDGMYSLQTKHQVLDYLKGVEGVKISKGTERLLKNANTYIWGGFFYADDMSIITFLNLISPGMVGNIHELIQPD